MNQVFLTRCIHESHEISENITYFKKALDDFANLINENLGVDSFKILIENNVYNDELGCKALLKDGDIVVWETDGIFNVNFFVSKKTVDNYLNSLTKYTMLDKGCLYFCLSSYISMKYHEKISKIMVFL
jgi:hypothetical protein